VRRALIALVVVFALAPAGTASAGKPLGIARHAIPAPPADLRPPVKYKERASQITSGVVDPQMLVPVRYLDNGRIPRGKYYDQDGNVYRFREVELIVRRKMLACPDSIGRYFRLKGAGDLFIVLTSVSQLLNSALPGLGGPLLAFLIPGLVLHGVADGVWDEVIYCFNSGQELKPRKRRHRTTRTVEASAPPRDRSSDAPPPDTRGEEGEVEEAGSETSAGTRTSDSTAEDREPVRTTSPEGEPEPVELQTTPIGQGQRQRRGQDEARRQEEARRREEARRQEEEQRRREEARRQDEEQRRREEARRQDEEQRRREEARRQDEAHRQEEAGRQERAGRAEPAAVAESAPTVPEVVVVAPSDEQPAASGVRLRVKVDQQGSSVLATAAPSQQLPCNYLLVVTVAGLDPAGRELGQRSREQRCEVGPGAHQTCSVRFPVGWMEGGAQVRFGARAMRSRSSCPETAPKLAPVERVYPR